MPKLDLQSCLREPLLHFLAIGLLIFAFDVIVTPERENPRVIVIDRGVRGELVELFEKSKGREPTGEEYEFLINRWLYDEIMYREAVALGLDKGDEMFRSRLELKLRAMLINSVDLDPPTDDDLREWLETHGERYATPARFDLLQIRIAGEQPERQARELAADLNSAGDEDRVRQIRDDSFRIYRNRSRQNIADVFGESFAVGLLEKSGQTWRALPFDEGWYVARVENERPQRDPDFKSLRPRLQADWLKFHNKRLAGEAFEEIRASYDIRREDRS